MRLEEEEKLWEEASSKRRTNGKRSGMGRDDDKSRKCRRWGGRKRNSRRLIV